MTLPSTKPPIARSQRARANKLAALWQFCRPHTVIGTTLSVLALYAIAGGPLWAAGLALLACWCGNVYIVGLNQLEDVAIDRINKPHLPLASGDLSYRQAQAIVGVTGLLALAIAALGSPYLLGMVALSLGLGTAYSLPPMRLKRFPFWASFCILTVRGLIVNLGLWWHFSQGATIPPHIWALTLFILIFTVAIAIFKDVPDMEGDRRYNISTLTLRLGQSAVFNLARSALTVCYGGMVVAGLVGLPGVNGGFLALTHLLALVLLGWRSRSVDLSDSLSISRFYQFIWRLFFLEYLLFPAACWLSSIP